MELGIKKEKRKAKETTLLVLGVLCVVCLNSIKEVPKNRQFIQRIE